MSNNRYKSAVLFLTYCFVYVYMLATVKPIEADESEKIKIGLKNEMR